MRSFLRSVRRTPYQSSASVIILFFTLLMMLCFMNLISFFYGVLSYVETRPQVIAYFTVESTENKVIQIKKQMESSGKTSTITYISKKQALEIYKNLNKDNPLLLEMVSADILPASLEIYAKKPEYLSQIAEYLHKQPEIEEVNFQKDIVEKLITITSIMRKIAIILFSFLTFITLTVLMTTTAFKISVKKDEIELMQLLGASNWRIRKPFLIEGMMFGIFAGTIAFFAFFGFIFYLKPFLTNYLTGLPALPFFDLGNYGLNVWPPTTAFIVMNYLVTIFFGAIIGLIGNFFATSKYIK